MLAFLLLCQIQNQICLLGGEFNAATCRRFILHCWIIHGVFTVCFSEDVMTDADQLQTQLKNILTQVKVSEVSGLQIYIF